MKDLSQIKLPEEFRKIVLKSHDEIEDIDATGFTEHQLIDPRTFSISVKKFRVKVNILIKKNKKPQVPQEEYKVILDDLFKYTYGSDMDFIEFSIDSFTVPSEKTNKEKFMDLFFK